MSDPAYRTRSRTSLEQVELQNVATTPASIVEDEDEPSYPPSTTATERPLVSLPEPDRGRAAYQFLFAAFVVETLVWGLPSAYGVFLTYYELEGVSGSKSGAGLLPLVGTFSSGLMYFLGPPVTLILNKYPHFRINAIRVGSMTVVAGLLVSSFAKTPWQLLLSQGLLYSLGGSLAYYPTFSFLSEWFVQRRGFANGVCFAGTAAGGLVYPFVLESLLSKYGASVTLQGLSVVTAVIFAVSLPLLRPRIPLAQRKLAAAAHKRDHDEVEGAAGQPKQKTLWKSVRLWVFMLANVAQAFGWFLPSLFLPTFAASLGLSGPEGSALLACVNASAVISRVGLGVLSDRMSPHRLGAITMAAASLSVLILWGITSTSFAPLLVFALTLGVFAGGWTSLYAAIIKDAAKDDINLATTLFGLISFTRGLGSILTAPISSYLVTHPLSASPTTGFGISNGKYGSMVIFVGVSLAVAAGMEAAVSM